MVGGEKNGRKGRNKKVKRLEEGENEGGGFLAVDFVETGTSFLVEGAMIGLLSALGESGEGRNIS